MTMLFKQLLITIALVSSANLLNILFIQDIRAESVAKEMKRKGQQCADWVETGDLRSDHAHLCIIQCKRYADTVAKNQELLTKEVIQRCNKAYATTKNRIAGMKKPAAPVIKAPDTIDEIINDMKGATQEWKVKVDTASDSTSKRQAQTCHATCVRGLKRVSRSGTGMNRAQVYWVNCTMCGNLDSVPRDFKTSRVVTKKQTNTAKPSMPDIEGKYLQRTRSGFRVRVEGRKDWKTYCNEAAFIKNNQDEFIRQIKPYARIRLIGITYDARKANKPVSRCSAQSAVIIDSGKE